jgi:competence protein ComEC
MGLAKTLNSYPLLRIALMLIAGILIGDRWGCALPLWSWIVVAGAIVMTMVLGKRLNVCLQGAGLMASVLLLGAFLVSYRNRELQFRMPVAETEYEAVVTSQPQQRGKTLQCEMVVTRLGERYLTQPMKVRATLLRDTTPAAPLLCVGDGIKAQSAFEPLRPWRQGSNFDDVRWLHTRGVAAQTFVYYSHWQKAAVSLQPLTHFERAQRKALRWRQQLLGQYERLALADQQLAVVAAMTLGDKSFLSRETRDRYAIAGASHVLALSGLHLGIIYTILTLLLGGGRRWRWLCHGIVLTAVWSYVVMVGMAPSVIRSAAMLTICSICTVLQRQQVSVNTLAFAAIVMLMVNPLNLWDVGFQMSFMAVMAIVIVYRPLFHVLPLTNRLLRWAWGLTAVSMAAQMGTAPLVLYYFGRFSTYFLLTNFIVIPGATLILYGAVALAVTMPIPALQQVVAQALAMTAGWLNRALAWTAALPGADISHIRINTLQLVLIYVAIIAFGIVANRIYRIRNQAKLEAFY